MDVLYEQGEATAQQVMENLPDAPGYSAVRALLRKLEDKGHIHHREEALKYVYFPLVDSKEASRNAITRLVRTFFEGSSGKAVNALLGMSMKDLSDEELDELEARIKKARKK
jgi:predicted transcriptional regulator